MDGKLARAQFYTSYWDGFIKFAKPSDPDLFKHDQILYKPYLHFPCEVPYVHFALNAPKTKPIRCELVLDNTHIRKLLLEILECREKLTTDGMQIDLEDVSCNYDRKARRFCANSEYNSSDNKTRYEQYEWMLDKLKRFQGYFPGLMTDIYKILGLKTK